MVTCHRCGGLMSEEKATDLPFRLDVHKILVIRDTPLRFADNAVKFCCLML